MPAGWPSRYDYGFEIGAGFGEQISDRSVMNVHTQVREPTHPIRLNRV